MDNKIAGLLGAVGALATLSGAQATTPADPTEVLKAGSYADLLKPIPNATAILEAIDKSAGANESNVKIAQFYRDRDHHHHHHHHHNSYYRRDRDEPRVIIVPRERGYGYRDHHHHHHHHHNSYYRRDRYDD